MVMPRKYDVGYKAKGDYGEFEVIEYIDKSKVLIKFSLTGYEVWCASNNVAKGRVKDPYYPNVWGVGYLGNAKASYKNLEGKTCLKTSYNTWAHMIRRCYGFAGDKVNTYDDCSVSDDWLCFEIYERWFDKYYKEGYQVDKDLKYLGNRVYSENTCTFIPNYINAILGYKTHNTVRQEKFKDLPVGVSFHKRDLVYCARCWDGGKLQSLGYHNNPQSAFNAYKIYKERLLKEIAGRAYSRKEICKQVYENLYNYVVYPEGHKYYLDNPQEIT